jgi:transposase
MEPSALFPKTLELERRRRHTARLLHQGKSPTGVARIFGVHRATLYVWLRWEQEPIGLPTRRQQGQPSYLSDPQLAQLEQFLLQGAKAHG